MFAGIALVLWQKVSSAKTASTLNERRVSELAAELAGVRGELAKAQTELSARAGFESLAVERAKTIELLIIERNGLKADLDSKGTLESNSQARIKELETELKNERQNLQEKIALLDTAEQKLANHFAKLAGDILDIKTKSFSETNKTELGTLIDPLREQIMDFRKKVEEAQKDNLVGRTELASELRQLRSLNENLSSEAQSLSKALRQDTQKQGHWGEQILLLILQKSGYLQRDIHYTYQEPFFIEDEETGSKSKQQTDVIVKLPEGRHLIIDCKVTLNAYRDYEDATSDEERSKALDRLLKSFRDHYKGLAKRNYQKLPGLQSPDFVVLFAPLEPAFMLAIQKDESLWMDAYQEGILLAGPTTVLFVVRIVENLWRQEQQARNVQKIIDRGEKLYEKFVGFVEDLETVGSKIGEADQSYKEALGKLKSGPGNLVRQVEMLRELGLKPKRMLKRKLLEEAGIDEQELEWSQAGLALPAEAEKPNLPK
jgi:DNA recombination protein RmuC